MCCQTELERRSSQSGTEKNAARYNICLESGWDKQKPGEHMQFLKDGKVKTTNVNQDTSRNCKKLTKSHSMALLRPRDIVGAAQIARCCRWLLLCRPSGNYFFTCAKTYVIRQKRRRLRQKRETLNRFRCTPFPRKRDGLPNIL
jgi:hypothetical protein